MPAKRFFACLREVKKLVHKEKYHFLHELVHVARSADAKKQSVEGLLKSFRSQFEGPESSRIKRMSPENQLRHNRAVASRMYMLFGAPAGATSG